MLPSGADVELGGVGFKLDQAYERITGRRCYVHGGRSIFAGRTDITGRPGAQNLKEDMLVWSLTRYDGEGQVVLDPANNASQFRFYRSEGLNFRTTGQAKLNKSTIATNVLAGTAGTTHQGTADFEDITGTASTTSGTDRRLTAVNTYVGSDVDVAYATARPIQLDFYLYRESFSTASTTIPGNDLVEDYGSTTDSGTDIILEPGATARTVSLATGTAFTAAAIQRVEFYMDFLESSTFGFRNVTVYILDVSERRTVSSKNVTLQGRASASTSPSVTLNFDPKAGHSYRFFIQLNNAKDLISGTGAFTVDKVKYGPEVTENTATIEVWNATAGSSVATKTVAVSAEAAGALVGSIAFYAAATATANYRARVKRISGKQAIWVDKAVFKDPNAAGDQWVIDCLDLGLGAQTAGVFVPKVWAGAHATGVDNQAFVWNTTTNVWDSGATLDTATGTALTVRAMAHSDAAEYFLLSSNEIVSCAADGTDTLRATAIPNAVGMCVAQGRLWALSEGTNVIIYAMPLEAASVDVTSAATVLRTTVVTATKTPDTSLRQRMCGTPTGARFFVNSGDVTAKVYEVDSSGTTLAPREIADLGAGVKATCIAYESGITFVGAQYYGDASASDSDKKPRSVMFAIDQNGVVQRIGFFRRDNPDVRPPQFMVPYQTDLYILQGNYVWRYSLVTGGLFLEYELNPATPGEQRSLAVLFGRTFAAYEDEIFVTGSVDTYRQASITGGNTYTSSVYDLGLPSVKKSLARIDVSTDTLASNTSVALEYQADQSGTWVLAGSHTTGSIASFYISETTFTTLQVRATLMSSDGVSTPVLRGITVWSSAAEDEEYFDLVLLTEDADSNFHIAGEQEPGSTKSGHVVNLWRRKAVFTYRDGYASKATGTDDYLVTIEDLRVEQNDLGEGRTVVTLRVVR